MKIVKDQYGAREKEVSVRVAIEGSMAGEGLGAIEIAADTGNNVSKAFAILVEALHENGAISDAIVAQMLSYRYAVIKD